MQVGAAVLYKVDHGSIPETMNSIFKLRNMTYNLRNDSLYTANVRSVHEGVETISFLGSKMWDLLHKNIKNSENNSIFKSNIKKTGGLKELSMPFGKGYLPNAWFI